MPLLMKCINCGCDVKVEIIQDGRKDTLFIYYCAKCGKEIEESIPKKQW